MSKIKDNGTLKDAHEFYKKNSAGTGLEYIEELYRKNSQGQLEKIFDAGWDTTVTSIPATLSNARAKPTSWEIKGKSQQGILPDGYTQLEYIQSTVTTSYIDTGIYSKNITSAEIKFNISNNNNYTGFGDTTVGTGSGYPASMWCENSAIKWYYSGGSAITLGSHDTDITATLPFPTQTAGSTVHIFHANGAVADKCVSGKYYYVRLLNGTNIVFNGIPAKDSNGVLGMYDTVTNTFFTNAGTGSFTAGPALPSPTSPVDVKGVGNSGLPSGYKKLEYIQSSGTQYIDTGVHGTQNTKVEETLQLISIPSGSAGHTFGDFITNTQAITMNLKQSGSSRFGDASLNSVFGTLTTDKHTYGVDKNGYSVDGVITTSLTGTTDFTTVGNLFWMSANYHTSIVNAEAKYYELKIWENNILVRNLIPTCNRNTNVIGMYDLVSDTFFTNAGTGDFIAGPEDTSCVVPVKVSGKNLIDISESTMSSSYTFKTLTSDEIAKWSNKQLTLSCYVDNIVSDIISCWAMYVYVDGVASAGNWINRAGGRTSVTFTIPSNTSNVRFICNRGGSSVTGGHSYNFQLEYGSTATSYESYTGEPTTYNINLTSPLHKIGTYTDSIESDGTLTRGVGVKVLDGTETWYYDQTWSRFFMVLSGLPSQTQSARIVRGFSTHYEWVYDGRGISSVTTGQGYFGYIGGAGDSGVYLHDSHTSVADFTAWLASNNVVIYYPLATATETTVQVPTISTVKGTNYLDIQTEVEPSSVSITYRKRTSA